MARSESQPDGATRDAEPSLLVLSDPYDARMPAVPPAVPVDPSVRQAARLPPDASLRGNFRQLHLTIVADVPLHRALAGHRDDGLVDLAARAGDRERQLLTDDALDLVAAGARLL